MANSNGKRKQTRPRHYAKPLSLYPLSVEEALTEVLKVKPPPKRSKKPQTHKKQRASKSPA